MLHSPTKRHANSSRKGRKSVKKQKDNDHEMCENKDDQSDIIIENEDNIVEDSDVTTMETIMDTTINIVLE